MAMNVATPSIMLRVTDSSVRMLYEIDQRRCPTLLLPIVRLHLKKDCVAWGSQITKNDAKTSN